MTALGKYRRDVPIEVWSAAGITAVRHEDCGPCTQLGVAMSERAGVRPDVLRAPLEEDADAMPADVAMVAAHSYPTVKYAMRHGQACTRVPVGDRITW